MEGIAAEVGQKLKSAIKTKLKELGAYVDDELSNYVMVMVTNRRSKAEMDRELQLFLGANTSTFTSWLQSVWIKLEQVTVANAGIESIKKKGIEKKKKTKKGAKSSSESDEEKKHKKKRKTSISEIITKDVKKRKSAKSVSNNSVKEELFSDDQETQCSEDRKLNADVESMDEEQENIVLGTKKHSTTDSVEEEDFLNIKEDFESEFLSDSEVFEGNAKSKTSSLDEYPRKRPPKSDGSEKSSSQNVVDKKHLMKHLKNGSGKTNEKTKDVVDHKLLLGDSRNTDNGMVSEKVSSKSSNNSQSNVDKKVDNSNLSKMTSSRRPLIRDRKLKSRSKSPVKAFKSRSRSPQKKKRTRQISSSRSRSPSRSRTRSNSRSRSPSHSKVSKGISTITIKSKSRSPSSNAGSKFIKIRDKSPSVVDARELINRKRAMVLASEQSLNSKDEKILTKRLRKNVDPMDSVDVDAVEKPAVSSGSKIIRIKGRERSKENVNVVKNVEDDDDDFEIKEKLRNKLDMHQSADNKYGPRFVVRKRDGRRCVTVHTTLENNFDTNLSSATNKNDTVDLREIKRTVYMDDKKVEDIPDDYEEDGDIVDDIKEKEGKVKLRQSVVKQINKYIKEEPQISSSVGKVTKITRPKMQTQSASSTLIRKAVADARKSLHNSKEESLKKKESFENKNTMYSSEKTNEDKNTTSEQYNSKSDEISLLSEDLANADEMQPNSAKSGSQNEDSDGEEKINMENGSDEIRTEVEEEYDPSENMPQFVVTLTGLDPKLFPQEDMDADQFDSIMEDSKLKPKLLERCKYYPNCLAGEQCLFYHPVIPCKMFPNCKYGNNCLYIHPKCKYDTMCTRYDCTFFHSTQRIAAPVSARHASAAPVVTSQPCKFYYNCVNPMCPFQHPKICRFDRFCTNKNCTFSHTSLSHVSTISKDKLKWSRPKDNENKPDSAESKAELEASVEN